MDKEQLLQDPVFYQFDKITKIPRKSGHEEKIRDYLYNWAKEKGIYVEKDDYNNVFMRKPASKGYENRSPIALQAHIDMVCEKNPDVDHDFSKDPITYYIDGNIVSTHNTTTLGADDGLGVAYILSILNDDNLKHPEIEAIFTADEEEGFSGARNFDASKLKSKLLMNLDHAQEDQIVCASAGGIAIRSIKEIEKINIRDNYRTYRLEVKGLKGGHSGEDIHRGNGNSSILLFRILSAFKGDFQILDLHAGSFRLAIPRDSSVDIAVAFDKVDKFKEIIEEYKGYFINEFPKYKDTLVINFNEIETDSKALLNTDRDDLIKLSLLYPNGIQEMSDVFPGLVKTSTNLGEIYIKDNKIYLVSEIRSLNHSEIDFLLYKARTISELFDYEFSTFGPYYCWSYKDNSPLRELTLKTFEEVQNQKITPLAVHAGLECGFFSNKRPDLDIVSVGPNCKNFHSPTEQTEIESVKKVYKSLIKLLESINF